MARLTENREAIDGFVSTAGFIVLKQNDNVLGKDVTIAIHPDEIDDVCQALQRYKADANLLRSQPDFVIGQGSPDDE